MSQMESSPLYRIVVRGCLDDSWSDYFDGMEVGTGEDDDGSPFTVMMGPVRDQAALQGILAKVWNLNLPLLEAICLSGYGMMRHWREG